jgi:hypothetical protein
MTTPVSKLLETESGAIGVLNKFTPGRGISTPSTIDENKLNSPTYLGTKSLKLMKVLSKRHLPIPISCIFSFPMIIAPQSCQF